MGTRTFPLSPNTSSHPRPDRRKWQWIIGGGFALLFVLGLAVSCAQPQDDRSFGSTHEQVVQEIMVPSPGRAAWRAAA